MAHNKADPRLEQLALPAVTKYLTGGMDRRAVQTVGTLTFTVTKSQPVGSQIVTISGCMDQSKAFPMDATGQRIIHTKEFPMLKMSAEVSDSGSEARVSAFAFFEDPCT